MVRGLKSFVISGTYGGQTRQTPKDPKNTMSILARSERITGQNLSTASTPAMHGRILVRDPGMGSQVRYQLAKHTPLGSFGPVRDQWRFSSVICTGETSVLTRNTDHKLLVTSQCYYSLTKSHFCHESTPHVVWISPPGFVQETHGCSVQRAACTVMYGIDLPGRYSDLSCIPKLDQVEKLSRTQPQCGVQPQFVRRRDYYRRTGVEASTTPRCPFLSLLHDRPAEYSKTFMV